MDWTLVFAVVGWALVVRLARKLVLAHDWLDALQCEAGTQRETVQKLRQEVIKLHGDYEAALGAIGKLQRQNREIALRKSVPAMHFDMRGVDQCFVPYVPAIIEGDRPVTLKKN